MSTRTDDPRLVEALRALADDEARHAVPPALEPRVLAAWDAAQARRRRRRVTGAALLAVAGVAAAASVALVVSTPEAEDATARAGAPPASAPAAAGLRSDADAPAVPQPVRRRIDRPFPSERGTADASPGPATPGAGAAGRGGVGPGAELDAVNPGGTGDRVAQGEGRRPAAPALIFVGEPVAAGEAIHVVRVQVAVERLAAFGFQPSGGVRSVNVDLLVGEDGVARGIRFER